MTRSLADDELRDLLRATYGSSRQSSTHPRRARPSATLSIALLLVGAVAGSVARGSWNSSSAEPVVVRRDPVEAVQATGSQYAEALAELAATPSGSVESRTAAREVVATSLVGVTRSLMTVVGGTTQTISLYRLASELRQESIPWAHDPQQRTAF